MSSNVWTIDKQIDFCYGHRVWSQELNTDYTGSEGSCLKCRHLHGHQGKLKVQLRSDTLNRGMVVDFKMMGWFKDFVDEELDHKMILDINDPILPHETPELITNGEVNYNLLVERDEGFWVPDMSKLNIDNDAVYEKYEGLVLVDFVPTSENLAAWLMGIAKKKMSKIGVDVVGVDYWETPKSHCRVDSVN